MEIALYILVFVYSLLVGSFLNVCIYRIPREMSIVFPGSHCTSCDTRLKAYELIPLFSYIALGGKCRTCGEKISARYPMVELITALLVTLQFHILGLNLTFAFFAIMTFILIVMTMIDYDLQIIPDGLTLILGIVGILYLAAVIVPAQGFSALIPRGIGFLLGGGLFLLIAIVSNGGMGGGDIKLMAVLGLWFGWQHLLLLMMLSFVSGALISVALLAFRIKGRKEAIPFGPFIALAAYLTSIFGNELVTWYLTLSVY
ncbi:prepilin peptidase [Acidaminobacter sp.]|uniref:prepilin peptidase n=1 Tax=Acidaminobacter sp. TaxID=1872102 RepID=UPI0025C43C36|nr:A24 family peptidase [Acidaminobacter sp.]